MAEYIEKEAVTRALTLHDCDSARLKMSICDLPAADVAPIRHGKWVKVGYACGETEWQCTACKETEWRTSSDRLKYCPFCGTMMDLEV